MGHLPLGLIGHEDTPTFLLVDVAVDDYRSARETGDRPLRRDVRQTLFFNLPGTGRSLPTPGGQDTPPRNAAQFIWNYGDDGAMVSYRVKSLK